MKDILKQIQQLQEDFMNLIEVEGLGEPASDVPPSTNKIKKDVKTKNGKVELVSVEDELFPKDGNAREQFRQKVIDIINGMIQGTATLEDLMQVVRSKKNAPLKESLDDQIEKKFKKGEISLDKAFELVKKIESKMSQDKNNEERADRIQKEADKYPTIERASQQRQIGKAIRRNQRKNALTFESLKEAMEVLEQLLGESKAKDPKGYKENMDIANHYDKLYSKEPAKAPDGSPNPVAAEWNRKYQEYFDKAMKHYYGDSKKKCSENFDKNEEKEYNECKALQLWEQIINEIEDRFYRRALKNSDDRRENAEKMKDLATTKKSKDAIDDILIPQNHKHEVVNSKFEDKVVRRVEDEYRKSKKKKGK